MKTIGTLMMLAVFAIAVACSSTDTTSTTPTTVGGAVHAHIPISTWNTERARSGGGYSSELAPVMISMVCISTKGPAW